MEDGHQHLALGAGEEDLSQTRIYVSVALLALGLLATVTLETIVAWSIIAYGKISQKNPSSTMART